MVSLVSLDSSDTVDTVQVSVHYITLSKLVKTFSLTRPQYFALFVSRKRGFHVNCLLFSAKIKKKTITLLSLLNYSKRL